MKNTTTYVMRNLVVITLILLACAPARAQQDEMYTQYFYNKLVLNPAYAGSRDAISVTGLYRTQWVGFDGAPKTQSFSIHAPVFSENIGLGLSIIHDEIGINDNMTINGAYAFRINFDKGRLALGINAQVKRLFMDWANTNPLEQGSSVIPYGNTTTYLPNFGAGLYYDADAYYVGVSVPHLIENKLKFGNDGSSQVDNIQARQRRHIFGMAGFITPVADEVEFQPSLLVKYVANAPVSVDVNASFIFYKSLLTGVSYRTGDSFDMIIQLFLKNNLRIGYAHDFNTTKLNDYHNGTHEIMLGIDFGKRSRGIDNPRYF
jgi:type IX secretion system PorP/SprF family membrane protein